MSAHLKFGTIHPRTMVADLDQRRAGARAYLRQLAFRDFYAAVLHHWPDSAWWNWNRDFDAIQTDTGADAKRRFQAWKAGETGFPIVDAGMRQLHRDRFHAQPGADGRRVVSGQRPAPAMAVGRPLVPRSAGRRRHGQQSARLAVVRGLRHRRGAVLPGVQPGYSRPRSSIPSGDYIRRWVPELADVDDVRLTKDDRPPGYPEPIVDHGAERSEALRRYQEIS